MCPCNWWVCQFITRFVLSCCCILFPFYLHELRADLCLIFWHKNQISSVVYSDWSEMRDSGNNRSERVWDRDFMGRNELKEIKSANAKESRAIRCHCSCKYVINIRFVWSDRLLNKQIRHRWNWYTLYSYELSSLVYDTENRAAHCGGVFLRFEISCVMCMDHGFE